MSEHLYFMRLQFKDEGYMHPTVTILSPYDPRLDRVVSDWGDTLKDVIEEDLREGGALEDHDEGVFNCKLLWEPHVHHYFEGDEYDVDIKLQEEKQVKEASQ